MNEEESHQAEVDCHGYNCGEDDRTAPGYYDTKYEVGDQPNWIDLADAGSLRTEIRRLRAEVRRLKELHAVETEKSHSWSVYYWDLYDLADELAEALKYWREMDDGLCDDPRCDSEACQQSNAALVRHAEMKSPTLGQEIVGGLTELNEAVAAGLRLDDKFAVHDVKQSPRKDAEEADHG